MQPKRNQLIRRISLFARRPVESARALLASANSRLRTAVFSRPFVPRKLPAWISIVLGFATRLAGHEERIRHIYDVTREMGGDPEVIVGIVESLWFSVALVAAGVFYLIFVGEPERGVRRHPAWSAAAWTALALVLGMLAFAPVYGSIELYIRNQIIRREAGVPSGTPSDPSAPGNQKPVFGAPRNLTQGQQKILYVGALKLTKLIPQLMLTYISSDNESYQYMANFQQMLKQAGIQVSLGEQLPEGQDQSGLMIVVPDPDKISEPAERLRELLVDMDLKPKFVARPQRFGSNPLILFIGPRPVQL